jgi:hypothetical protein
METLQEVYGETIDRIEIGDTWVEIYLHDGRSISISARGSEPQINASVS